jgi:hypothetical protein
MNRALSASDEKNWAPTIAKKAAFMGPSLYHSHDPRRFRFDCNNWIDLHMDNSLILMELKLK